MQRQKQRRALRKRRKLRAEDAGGKKERKVDATKKSAMIGDKNPNSSHPSHSMSRMTADMTSSDSDFEDVSLSYGTSMMSTTEVVDANPSPLLRSPKFRPFHSPKPVPFIKGGHGSYFPYSPQLDLGRY